MMIKTYSPTNKFRFACPIFGAEVEIAGCLSLREMMAIGKKPEQRRGCQACIKSSKCPIPRIMMCIQRTGEDPYYAAEPKVGTLRPDVLDNIRPILVHEPYLDEFNVPPSERELILVANESAGDQTKAKSSKRLPIPSVKFEPIKGEPKASHDALTDAAMTGDMSAAISRAAESPVEALAPVTAPTAAVVAPTPLLANVAPPARREIAKSPQPVAAGAKKPSLLEMARMRRAS